MTTITIKGSAPKFNQQEFEQRQAAYRNIYLDTMECRETIRAELPHQFLLNVIEKSNQGYVLDMNTPLRLESLNYRAFMTKPDHMQIADLAAADIKIKEAYIAELEAERERYRQLVIAQLLQKAELAEQRKIDDKKAKLLAEVQIQVDELFGKLVVPD